MFGRKSLVLFTCTDTLELQNIHRVTIIIHQYTIYDSMNIVGKFQQKVGKVRLPNIAPSPKRIQSLNTIVLVSTLKGC